MRTVFGKPLAGYCLGGRIDPMPRIKPTPGTRRGRGLVFGVPAPLGAMQQQKRRTGLRVDVRAVLACGALDQRSGLVFQEQQARLSAPVQQSPDQSGGDQLPGVPPVRGELASDVVVRSPGTLDDELAVSCPHMQNFGVQLAP